MNSFKTHCNNQDQLIEDVMLQESTLDKRTVAKYQKMVANDANKLKQKYQSMGPTIIGDSMTKWGTSYTKTNKAVDRISPNVLAHEPRVHVWFSSDPTSDQQNKVLSDLSKAFNLKLKIQKVSNFDGKYTLEISIDKNHLRTVAGPEAVKPFLDYLVKEIV